MSITKRCMPHGITVFHRMGESGRVASYHKTFISGVRLEQRLAVSQKKIGESSLETFKAIIDVKMSKAYYGSKTRKYLSSDDFAELKSPNTDSFWTVSEGDYIFPQILTSEDSAESVTLLKNKMRVFTVNSVSEQYGQGGIHHLEVSGRGKLLE